MVSLTNPALTGRHAHSREPRNRRALHLHRHRGHDRRRAARFRLRAAPGRRRTDPARPPHPDRALRGRRRAPDLPRGAAQGSRRARRRGGGSAGCGPLVRQCGRRRGALARGGPPGARDGGDVRRGRIDGPRRPDEPARHAPQPARPRRARAQVRPGGARSGHERPRPARAARAAGLPATGAPAGPGRSPGRRPRSPGSADWPDLHNRKEQP